MPSLIRPSARLALLVAALLVVPPLAAPAPVDAATFPVRLEAGPQRGVTFDASWAVTTSRTVSLSSPASVTASARHAIRGGGTWLALTSGPLSGRWVRESTVAYISGYAGRASFAVGTRAFLPAGRYELYRFDTAGALVQARGLVVGSAGLSLPVAARAIVNGRAHVRVGAGTWADWWLPGTATAPTRIGCTVGRPPTGTTARIVSSVGTATGEIALTFDMGGRLTDAVSIVRYLELARICATIFPTSVAAQTTIGRVVMAEIRAHPELFEVGNHTVHHCNLRDGGGGASCPPVRTRPSATFVTRELVDADAVIASLAGRHTAPYWRPPYGAVDATLAGVAARAGYPYTIMWSTDTIDWKRVVDGGPTAAQISAKVIANRRAGGIVLMHLGGYNTRNALPAMLAGLAGQAYTPTSLSALWRAGH